MGKRARTVVFTLLSVLAVISIVCIRLSLRRNPAAQPLGAELHFTRADWLAVESIGAAADLKILGGLCQAQQLPNAPPNHEQPLYRLLLDFPDRQADFWLMHDLRVFNQSQAQEIVLDPACRELLAKYVEHLRGKQFGELLPWSEAKRLLPVYSVFSVVDLETGLTFKTQRRAGSEHADIQPLTRQDTEIMRTIYGGAWSWDRRAVVIEIGGRRIAASMNGMPHGAGALVNGFPGHHCLHFLGSITHGGGKADPMHQLMVQKAAGCLHEYLEQLPPEQLQVLALELTGQGDAATLGLITLNSGTGMHESAAQIRDITIWSKQPDAAENGTQTGAYAISVFFRGDQREYRVNVTVTCRYSGELGKWLVEPAFLQQLLAARQ